MASVALASYRLQIGWSAYNVGLLSFDHSTFGGPDVFGISPLDATFGGTYDDVTKRLDQAIWGRGRNTNLELMLAGQADFDLRDPAGIFNPNNVAGPLFGQLEDRMHPVNFEGTTTAGGKRGLFRGWARAFEWEPNGRRGTTRVHCVDAFYWLDRVNPIIASTGTTTTGAAIGLILDAAGLNDSAMRDLNVGDTIPDFSADGSKSGLELIQGLLDAERGVFFVAGSGKATYRSRLSRLTSSSLFTLADRMSALGPGVDFDLAKTRVTVARINPVTGVRTYTAIASTTGSMYQKIGTSDLPAIETPYLLSDSQADGLAAWILSQVRTPTPPMYALTIDNRDSDLLEQILSRELNDRITATSVKGGTGGDFVIDKVSHTLIGRSRRHTCALTLSRASTASPIIFDVSTFDSPSVFVY